MVIAIMSLPLYRNFTTQQQLDEQYDVERSVPDFGMYVKKYIETSARTRNKVQCLLDIPYGAKAGQTLDVFYPGAPTDPKLKPAVFFVHGGFWKATTSKEWSFVAAGLSKLGIVTVVENYTLCPNCSVAEIVEEHKGAYSFLWKNAEHFGIDRNRIMLVGHSVGGHGVAELLSTDWRKHDMPRLPYVGAIAVSGLFDVRPIPHTFAGPTLGLTADAAKSLSTNLRVTKNYVPLMVVVGNQEPYEFIRQSVDYAEVCSEKGWGVEINMVEKNHFDILDEFFHGEGSMVDYLCRRLEVQGAK